jgi:two-component system, NarL family, nitrate/nitrite response regulator NarL
MDAIDLTTFKGDNLPEWPNDPPMRLMVVTEARFLGEAFATLLERDCPRISVTCATIAEILGPKSIIQADGVLVDASHSRGRTITKHIRTLAPHIPIIAYPVLETNDDVILWAEAGATGYLPSNIGMAQIGPVVTKILEGEQICSGRTAAALLRRIAVGGDLEMDGYESPPPVLSLTIRERQVAELIIVGFGDKQIARELNIGLATTKTHVHKLLTKLKVKRRTGVINALFGAANTGESMNRAS